MLPNASTVSAFEVLGTPFAIYWMFFSKGATLADFKVMVPSGRGS